MDEPKETEAPDVEPYEAEGVGASPLPPAVISPVDEPYAPDRDRERARAWLAGALVGILGAIIAFTFATIWWTEIKPAEIKDLLSILIAPMSALAGSATGFYFGGRASKTD